MYTARSLKRLSFANCLLTAEFIEKIIQSINANPNSISIHIDFSENDLSEKGGKLVAEKLSTSNHIAFIDFGSCNLKKDGTIALLQAVAKNKEIKGVDVSYTFYTSL